jgi:hypothetical protein
MTQLPKPPPPPPTTADLLKKTFNPFFQEDISRRCLAA